MKSQKGLLTIFIFFLVPVCFAQTDIPAGSVDGTWRLINSPYHINGEITIPDGSSLIIEPGVHIVFIGYYKFNVQGQLLAVGTVEDTILFTAQNRVTGWHGIRFISTPASNDSSKIVYCKLQYGWATGTFPNNCGGAIILSGVSKCLISHCLITNNHASYVGGGIVMGYGSHPIISNNVISNNIAPYGGGIAAVSNCNPLIINNIINHNNCSELGGGIQLNQNSNPAIINNTIVFNHAGHGGGIDCRDNSDPTLINTILCCNTATDGNQVCLYVENCDPNFYNCNVEGGLAEFGGAGRGDNYSGVFENNLDCEPFFENPANDDYHLCVSSLCIGMGIDSMQKGTRWYCAPAFDFEDHPRPNPTGSNPDIGAFESELGSPVTGIDEIKNKLPQIFLLDQNYPNPFNPFTMINYQLPVTSDVELSIYNLMGQKMITLVSENQPAGTYTIDWNGKCLPSGMYLYQLKAGEFTETRKLVLQK